MEITELFAFEIARGIKDIKTIFSICEKYDNNIVNHVLKPGRINKICQKHRINMNEGLMIDVLDILCKDGEYKYIQWLVDTFDVTREDMLRNNCHCLISSLSNGYITISKFLIKVFNIKSDDFDVNSTLRICCFDGDLSSIKWIIKKFSINVDLITAVDLLHHACLQGHMHVINWLIHTYDIKKDDVTFLNEIILDIYYKKPTDFSEWVVKFGGYTYDDIKRICKKSS